MYKWKVVYRNEHGYVEQSPILYPKEKKTKIQKQKRNSYKQKRRMSLVLKKFLNRK